MNRKNLTAAVLAGLAGVAGIAGTAQAVNLNPDGLGEVLIYPYYTTNDGNNTILTVVNTTSDAKAVKVRFLEGYNSREVLDFNLYLSPYDVWVANIVDGGVVTPAAEGLPHLIVPDSSCTVPYLYGMGVEDFGYGLQALLPYAFEGDNADGGPTTIDRASEGYFEMIEMGVMTGDDGRAKTSTLGKRMDSKTAVTHVLDDETGEELPADCDLLVRNWTEYESDLIKDDPWDGWWYEDALIPSTGSIDGDCDDPATTDTLQDLLDAGCGQTDSPAPGKTFASTESNGGGLFGSAAIINVGNGTMFSYDAKAIQGYDSTVDGVHFEPGTIHPSLNDGNNNLAFVYWTPPGDDPGVAEITYPSERTVEAISAVFMHDMLMNTFVIDEDINAATEWVMTHPTKSWYVDPTLTGLTTSIWTPNPADPGCLGWDPGEPFCPRNGPDFDDIIVDGGGPNECSQEEQDVWEQCTYIDVGSDKRVFAPFTSVFDGKACENVDLDNWNREESPTNTEFGSTPPVVSPRPPGPVTPGTSPFQLCYEVNVLRFGEESVFGTDSDLLLEVSDSPSAGWARVDLTDTVKSYVNFDGVTVKSTIEAHQDRAGLTGLPTTGFAAEQYENGTLEGGSVLANYGGLFGHKGSIAVTEPTCDLHSPSSLCD